MEQSGNMSQQLLYSSGNLTGSVSHDGVIALRVVQVQDNHVHTCLNTPDSQNSDQAVKLIKHESRSCFSHSCDQAFCPWLKSKPSTAHTWLCGSGRWAIQAPICVTHCKEINTGARAPIKTVTVWRIYRACWDTWLNEVIPEVNGWHERCGLVWFCLSIKIPAETFNRGGQNTISGAWIIEKSHLKEGQ